VLVIGVFPGVVAHLGELTRGFVTGF